MKLSICFATLNRVRFLRACFDSIYHSVGDLDFEIIVADGGSTDGTLDLLRVERERTNLTLIEQGKPLGCVKAFNDCFWHAHGEHVVNINDDCTVEPDTLANASRLLDETEDAGQIAIPYTTPTVLTPKVSMMRIAGRLVPYANFGVTMKCLGDKVGWWGSEKDVNLFRYAGDNHLSMSCWASGCKVVPLPVELGHITHYESDDATRINSPSDTTKFYSYWSKFKWD